MFSALITGSRFLASLKDWPPLFFRLILAYGFYGAAFHKFQDIASVGGYFALIGIPFPHVMAYVVAGIEALGVPLLLMGLATRAISTALFVIMLTAIGVAHLPFHEDFSMALWFALALFSLIVTGAGRWSLDHHVCPCEKALSCCSPRGERKGSCC